ncbi:hypothetical protein ABPG74_001355 [Tetrahymena malaccensis]
MNENIKQYQQLNKSIQQIFSSTKRLEPLSKQLNKHTDDYLKSTIEQENNTIDTIQTQLYQQKMDQNLNNQKFGYINMKIKEQAKAERLFSDESASDCSPVLRPSLPQTPTQNYQNNLKKNKVISFSNISKAYTNTHASLSPKTTASIPQTPQKQNFDKRLQNYHTIGEEKNIQKQDKQKYFSHFRNQSNPCILNTSQQEFADQNYIEGSCKTQSQVKQIQNFQLNENQNDVIKNEQLQIKFTNPMIQSKVVSLQSTPKNSQQNTLNQQHQSNQATNFTSSENAHGIHLFHSRNQQKKQMLKQQYVLESQKKMNNTIFNLNDLIPNLYYINSSYKNEKDLLQLIERKKQQLKLSLTTKDTPLSIQSQKQISIKQSQPSTTNQFQHIQRQIRQNRSPQYIQKQNKVVFSNLLSQTFNNNFEQYNVIESGITRKLKQSIRQKSAISQSLNNSQVNSKNFNQQVSFEDDFQEYISKYQSPGCDDILGNQHYEKKQEDYQKDLLDNNQKGQNQHLVYKSLYPIKSSLNKNHQSSIQNIFLKEQSKKVENEEGYTMKIQNSRTSSNLKSIQNNQINMNQNIKQSDEKNTKYVKLLLNKEKNQQIEQFKILNKSQSFAIKNKEDQVEKVYNFSKNQINKNQNDIQNQKILLKQSNPFQLLSSTPQTQHQYNYILKKDLLFNKFLDQEKQRLKQ